MSFAAGGIMGAIGGAVGLAQMLRGGEDSIFRRGQLQGVGNQLYKFLLERLRTDPVDTESFGRMSTALREGLRRQGGAAIQELSETAQARGFLDSGEVIGGMQNIRRGELGAFASGTREILEMLEARRLEGVLPFLGLGTQEFTNRNSQNIARTGQAISALQSSGSMFNQSAAGISGQY